MATCAHNGQAVGMAAAMCFEEGLNPRDLNVSERMVELQRRLLRSGQHIPGITVLDLGDMAQMANITATSELALAELKPSGESAVLERPFALLLPVQGGSPVPTVSVVLTSEHEATVRAELWGAGYRGNTSPDVLLGSKDLRLSHGEQTVALAFDVALEETAHLFYMLHPVQGVSVALSQEQVTGVLTLSQRMNKAVAKSLVQTPPEGSGIDTFAFWLPERRPAARNLAVTIEPALRLFGATNVADGIARPWCGVNAWVPAREDGRPSLRLEWGEAQTIWEIEISFDTDFDHPMEAVLMGHPERVMPACITEFEVCAAGAGVLAHVAENHQTRWSLRLEKPVVTKELSIAVLAHGPALPAIFEVRCY